MVEIKIDQRKVHIFNVMKPFLIELYENRYKITLTKIELDLDNKNTIVEDNKDIPPEEDEEENPPEEEEEEDVKTNG